MEDRTSNYYNIHSEDRLSGTATNCTVRNQNFTDSFSLRMTKAIIPFTFYNVTSNYNTLIINSSGNKTVTLTPGQYTILSLLSSLKTLLDALAVGVFTLTANSTTYKITIASTVNFAYLGTLSTINDILGFDSVDTSSAASHTGTLIYNLGGTDYIDIISRTLTNSESKTRSTNTKGGQLFARIPTSQYSFGQTIFYQPFHQHQWTFRMNLQEDIDLQLQDSNGNILDLNGREWEMTLKFHTNKSNNPGNDSRAHLRVGNDMERFYHN